MLIISPLFNINNLSPSEQERFYKRYRQLSLLEEQKRNIWNNFGDKILDNINSSLVLYASYNALGRLLAGENEEVVFNNYNYANLKKIILNTYHTISDIKTKQSEFCNKRV